MVARRCVLAVAMLLCAIHPAGAATRRWLHPLHTTLTDITIDPATHAVRAVVRIFADDIGASLVKRAGSKSAIASDADATAYVASELSIVDQSLRAFALRPCGVKRSGDLLWVCVESGPVDLKSVRIRNAVLCELFPDQVNIVQVSGAGARRSILFTRGDGPKSLL